MEEGEGGRSKHGERSLGQGARWKKYRGKGPPCGSKLASLTSLAFLKVANPITSEREVKEGPPSMLPPSRLPLRFCLLRRGDPYFGTDEKRAELF